ncbi:dipeptide epimerase [Alphaproteobacteria bacterium]|nr:dipeptide epimerase [Alphaproteobacteria bacterium]
MSDARRISIQAEAWPLRQRFAIARGAKLEAETICVEIRDGPHIGRGEAVPYGRYGETVESVTAAIEDLGPLIEAGMARDQLSDALFPGAARSALDCALWDLEAKKQAQPAWQLAGLSAPKALQTAYTISLDGADKMAEAAAAAREFSWLKIKLGSADGLLADIARLEEICNARPDAKLIVDANEAWRTQELARYQSQLARFGVVFFEQPVAAADEAGLQDIALPFCADESVHDRHDLEALSPAYTWVNIKLDKAGGLSEALAMQKLAHEKGLKVLVGCMVATSLAMAPAFLLAQQADLVDLDGPLWLKKDRPFGHIFQGAWMQPPSSDLWG